MFVFPLKGSAADVCKLAMVRANKMLGTADAQLIIQIHDELIYQVDSRDLAFVTHTLAKAMENSVDLKVPTPVAIKVGHSWGRMTEQ